jgi:hypothetical protein
MVYLSKSYVFNNQFYPWKKNNKQQQCIVYQNIIKKFCALIYQQQPTPRRFIPKIR